MREAGAQVTLVHRIIDAGGLQVHVVECGPADGPAVLLLHGWPESWAAFERLMAPLGRSAHVAAIDLPGIGGSDPAAASDKRTLACHVRAVIEALGLRRVTLVGHDIGGQVVYAYLHEYPRELARAVIMSVVVPGVDPWDEVLRNPHLWHFAFHEVRDLPERLVAHDRAAYFGFFYDAIAAHPGAVTQQMRRAHLQAYAEPQALHAGFEWYRAFSQDAKDNRAWANQLVVTPVLYLRGDREPGGIDRYLSGLRASGLHDVRGATIRDSGHFTPEEQPGQVVAAMADFTHGG